MQQDGAITQWEPMEEGILGPCSFFFKQTSEKQPHAVNGVRGRGCPPPFLTKTLVMVEDPETNSIISWNSSGTSFVIWDHLKFAKELLPKYFKHSNFSSFIYQLNNYGFKKIGLRQYEYENEWFQAGKQHLLLNMKRRNEAPKSTRQQQEPRKLCSDEENGRMVTELEDLKENIYLLKLDNQKLKQRKGDFENLIATFEKQVNHIENKVQKMSMFLCRILNDSSVQQIIENPGEEQELESHHCVKKMRLTATGNSSEESTDKVNNLSGKNQGTPPEKQADDSGSQILGQKGNDNSAPEAISVENCNALIICKKLLEDEQELAQQHSKIDMALDDMMASKIVMEAEDVIANEPITDLDDEVTFQLWA